MYQFKMKILNGVNVMKSINKKYLSEQFDRKIIHVRKLEAQKHHQEDMYAKPLQNKRKDKVVDIMMKYCNSKTFYDIGCAEGLFCNLAMSFGAISAKGVDVVDVKVEKAQTQFPGCFFQVKNCLNLNEKNQYGLVLCSEVLQHIVDYRKCLNEIDKILEENGILILTTPNLSQGKDHTFANLDSRSSPNELLNEIGGASFGKQNAIWKFNTRLLCKEIENEYSFKLVEYIKIGAKPINNQTKEQASNLFSVMAFSK